MTVLDELVAILGFDLRGERDARRYQSTLTGIDRKLDGLSNRAMGVGRVLTGLFVALGAAKVVNGAVSFEEAMADVNKVVDATPAQMDALSDTMLRMSRQLPVSAEGLASIAAEAGAAGIALEDLEAFTEQVAIAVTAFDLPAERVGEVMAKLGNVFGFAIDDMSMFNDTVNYLSNNMAAKAGELLDFTNRAAGAANLLGITAVQLAGVGAAMIAAGIIPQTAARGLNALATRIQTDAEGVNDALKSVGLSTAEMQEMLAGDGDDALITLFESISKLDVSKQAVALKALVGQDFSDDFSKLTNNPELLAQALSLANDEAGKLGSAQREYNTRAETTRAKWTRTKGIITSVGVAAAGPLLDGFKRVADKVFEITTAIDNAETSAEALQAVAKAVGFDVSIEQAQKLADKLQHALDIVQRGLAFITTRIGEHILFISENLELLEIPLKVVAGLLIIMARRVLTLFGGFFLVVAALDDFLKYLADGESLIGNFIEWLQEFLGVTEDTAEKITMMVAAVGGLILLAGPIRTLATAFGLLATGINATTAAAGVKGLGTMGKVLSGLVMKVGGVLAVSTLLGGGANADVPLNPDDPLGRPDGSRGLYDVWNERKAEAERRQINIPKPPPFNPPSPSISQTDMSELSDYLARVTTTAAAAGATVNNIETNAIPLAEQTSNIDNTKNITNNITNNITVNQSVTGTTAASDAATATQRAAQRGTDRGLTVANEGPQ